MKIYQWDQAWIVLFFNKSFRSSNPTNSIGLGLVFPIFHRIWMSFEQGCRLWKCYQKIEESADPLVLHYLQTIE